MSIRWAAGVIAGAAVAGLVVSGARAGLARGEEPTPEPSASPTGVPDDETSPTPTDDPQVEPTTSETPKPSSPAPTQHAEPLPAGSPVERSPAPAPNERPVPNPGEVEPEGGSGRGGTGAPRVLQSSATVAVVDDAFSPTELTVTVGTTVVWTIRGANPHTVTADDRSFDSGTLERGQTFAVTFDQPAVVPYYCQIHGEPGSGMTGVVNVRAAPTSTGPPPDDPTVEPDALARTGFGLAPLALGALALAVVGLGALRLGRRSMIGRG
jgi:plastocyanin